MVHETRKLACVRCVLLRQRIIERDCPSPTPCPPKIRGIFDSWSFAHAFVRIFPFITHYSTQTSDRLRAKRILADHVTAGRCVACGYATLQQCVRGEKKGFAALSRSLHASRARMSMIPTGLPRPKYNSYVNIFFRFYFLFNIITPNAFQLIHTCVRIKFPPAQIHPQEMRQDATCASQKHNEYIGTL